VSTVFNCRDCNRPAQPFRRAPINAAVLLSAALLSVQLCQAQNGGGGQEEKEQEASIRFGGTATVTGDVYVFSAPNDSNAAPRRPANLWRLILAPTISFGDVLTLPFNIMITTRESSVTTPATGGSNLLQFLQDPGNNIGFLSISPRIGWFKAHLGSHVPQYSELSSGDGQVFGAGVELRPGKFRFSASSGTIQRAINADSAAGVRGAYARWIYLTKLGYGSETGDYFDVNFVRARDDPQSVSRKPEGVDPQEGLLLSSNFRFVPAENVTITGEAGTCFFTHDMNASDIPDPDPGLNSFIRQRISSHVDYAAMLAGNYSVKDWGVKALFRYIGAGYMALGYPFMQPDRMEFLLSPRAQFFENRLALNGSIGSRTNNLSNTKAQASNQFIGSLNALGIITDELSIAASYTNFGVRNNMTQDTLKIETVSNSFNLNPTYTLSAESIVHTISATYSQDSYNDYNVVSGAENSNVTQSIAGNYAASFTKIPLSTSAAYNYMTNNVKAGELTISSVTLGGSWRFDDAKIVPSISLTYSTNRLASFTSDRQFFASISTRWQISRVTGLTFSASVNDYTYGSSRPGAGFTETLMQLSATTRF